MNESIMKTDRLGRLRYAPEQKAAIIEAYLASGMRISGVRPEWHGIKAIFVDFHRRKAG